MSLSRRPSNLVPLLGGTGFGLAQILGAIIALDDPRGFESEDGVGRRYARAKIYIGAFG